MEWSDRAIILGTRRAGESGLVYDVLSRTHGRTQALVYGAASAKRKVRPQAGDGVSLTWRGRLADSLGFFSTFELTQPHSAIAMQSGLALAGLNAMMSMARDAVPEGPDFEAVYDGLELVLGQLNQIDIWPALYIRWEAGLLSALGYGLDLDQCALTGRKDDLAFVSPRSGRAACREAGAVYADKLLILPAFMIDAEANVTGDDLVHGFALTGHFLERRVLEAQGKSLAESRTHMIMKLGLAGCFA